MGKSTIKWAIFNSYVRNYQSVRMKCFPHSRSPMLWRGSGRTKRRITLIGKERTGEIWWLWYIMMIEKWHMMIMMMMMMIMIMCVGNWQRLTATVEHVLHLLPCTCASRQSHWHAGTDQCPVGTGLACLESSLTVGQQGPHARSVGDAPRPTMLRVVKISSWVEIDRFRF